MPSDGAGIFGISGTGKVKAYNDAWAKHTGYPLFRIPNAAHNSNVDNPAAVNGIIADFLRNLK